MPDSKDEKLNPSPTQPLPPNLARQARQVEVLVDNLGPDLLKKGTISDDPRVVALLKTQGKHKLVREVK